MWRAGYVSAIACGRGFRIEKMIYIVCVVAVGGGWWPVAFSSRSSPLQIWASIIIDPARAVGGRHFLPLILGRAGARAHSRHIYWGAREGNVAGTYGRTTYYIAGHLGALTFNETGRGPGSASALAQPRLVMILYQLITANSSSLWYCRRVIANAGFSFSPWAGGLIIFREDYNGVRNLCELFYPIVSLLQENISLYNLIMFVYNVIRWLFSLLIDYLDI